MNRNNSKNSGKGLRKFHYTICKYLPQIIRDGQIDLATAGCFRKREHAVWVSTNEFWEESANKSYRANGQIYLGDRETTRIVGGGLARIEVNPKSALFNWTHYVKKSKTPGRLQRAMESIAFESGADPSEWYAGFKPINKNDWYRIEVFDRDEQCWKPYSKELDGTTEQHIGKESHLGYIYVRPYNAFTIGRITKAL